MNNVMTLEEKMNNMALRMDEITEGYKVIDERSASNAARLDLLDSELNVMGAVGRFKRQRKTLTSKVRNVVMKACGGHGTDEYILFYRSYAIDVYRHIHDRLGISNIDNLSMKNWEDPESDFQVALHVIEEWKPSTMLTNNKVADFIAMARNNPNWNKTAVLSRYINSSLGVTA